MGGYVNSLLVLDQSKPNSSNKKRVGHAAVVCNGGIYVVGGCNGHSILDCIEPIDANDLLQSYSTTSSIHEINWMTFNCRLSTERRGCRAVAVHDRCILLMGGRNRGKS